MGVLVVGTGRCGTVWLSRVLNAGVPDWQVTHEKWGYESRLLSRKAVASFLKPLNRCEVSQCLTEAAPRLDVAHKMVIVRHPEQVFLSFASRPKDSQLRWEHRLEGIYLAMSVLVDQGAHVLRFDRLVEDHTYLLDKFRLVGMDVDPEATKISPANQSTKTRATIPARWRALLETVAMPFWDRYAWV